MLTADWNAYRTSLSVRHAPDYGRSEGGFAWNVLPARLEVYRSLLERPAVAPGFTPTEWRSYLQREVVVQSQTLSHLRQLRDGALSGRKPAMQEALRRTVQKGVLDWLMRQGNTGDELCIPVLCVDATRPNHMLYVGFSVENGDVLRVRIDDSWRSHHAEWFPANQNHERPKVSNVEFTFPRKAMRYMSVQKALARLCLCPQGGAQLFYKHITRILVHPGLARRGVKCVVPAQQTRPLAVQAGNVCYLKNHSRGIASRLHDALCRGKMESRASVAVAARDAWHWLKEEERKVAAELTAREREGKDGN